MGLNWSRRLCSFLSTNRSPKRHFGCSEIHLLRVAPILNLKHPQLERCQCFCHMNSPVLELLPAICGNPSSFPSLRCTAGVAEVDVTQGEETLPPKAPKVVGWWVIDRAFTSWLYILRLSDWLLILVWFPFNLWGVSNRPVMMIVIKLRILPSISRFREGTAGLWISKHVWKTNVLV